MISNLLLLASASAFWATLAILAFWRWRSPETLAAVLFWFAREAFVWSRQIEASIDEQVVARKEWRKQYGPKEPEAAGTVTIVHTLDEEPAWPQQGGAACAAGRS